MKVNELIKRDTSIVAATLMSRVVAAVMAVHLVNSRSP